MIKLRIIRKKRTLRPWVGVAVAFIIGVGLVSQVFKLTDSWASEGEKTTTTIHGVISLNLNGKSYVKNVDGTWAEEIILDTKENYVPCQIVTVVFSDGKVVKDYITEGNELDNLMDTHGRLVKEYQIGIRQAISE